LALLPQYLPPELQAIACDPAATFESSARAAPRPQHPGKHLALVCSTYASWSDFEADLRAASSTPNGAGHNTAQRSIVVCLEERSSLENKHARFLELLPFSSSVSAASQLAQVSVNTGLRWASQAGHAVKRRPKSLNTDALTAIRVRLAEGEDRREIAEAFQVSLVSINRLLSTEVDLRSAWRAARHRNQLQLRRGRFSDLLARYGNATASRLRELSPADWVWLYRHDREWLQSHLPALWADGTPPTR